MSVMKHRRILKDASVFTRLLFVPIMTVHVVKKGIGYCSEGAK